MGGPYSSLFIIAQALLLSSSFPRILNRRWAASLSLFVRGLKRRSGWLALFRCLSLSASSFRHALTLRLPLPIVHLHSLSLASLINGLCFLVHGLHLLTAA